MYSKILVATDGSDVALRAARQAVDIIKAHQVTVTILSVVHLPPLYNTDLGNDLKRALVDDYQKALNWTKTIFDEAQIPCRTKLVEGYPSEMIVTEAGDHDLVVLGSYGRGSAAPFGSVSRQVAAQAPCSVLIVK